MRKLTIFRTGEYDSVSSKLLSRSASKIYALAKEALQTYGEAKLIVSSHIPEAMNTAKVIQQVMTGARLMEQPRLSRYHAGGEEKFKVDFLGYVRHYCSYFEHIVLVTHNMNISALTGLYVERGASATLIAEDWQDIFDRQKHSSSIQVQRLEACEMNVDSLVSSLRASEKEIIAKFPFVFD